MNAAASNIVPFSEPSQTERELAMSQVISARCHSLKLTPSETRRCLNVARALLDNGASIAWATAKANGEAEIIAYLRDGDGPEAA